MVGSKFPTIKSLSVRLAFLDARRQVLEEKSLDLRPSDVAIFTAACPGRCGRGSFDFTQRIADAVNGRLPMSESADQCRETLFAGSPETCGCEARCRVEIEYLPSAS